MEKPNRKVIDLRTWRPGIRCIAADLMASPEFKLMPKDIADDALRQAVDAQEIADSAIYKMLSKDGARG